MYTEKGLRTGEEVLWHGDGHGGAGEGKLQLLRRPLPPPPLRAQAAVQHPGKPCDAGHDDKDARDQHLQGSADCAK